MPYILLTFRPPLPAQLGELDRDQKGILVHFYVKTTHVAITILTNFLPVN